MKQVITCLTTLAMIFLLTNCGEKNTSTDQVAVSQASNADELLEQAMAYRDGTASTPADSAKAFDLFMQSANGGNVCAPFFIGVMYENGEHGPVDLPKALEWLTKADEAGCGADLKRLPALKAKMKK